MTSNLRASVLAQLLLRPGASALDLAEDLGVDYHVVSEVLVRLLDEHAVQVVGTQQVTRSGAVALRYEVCRG